MKLREFVANSLPRVRGRKKKIQPQKTTVAKERCDANQQPKCQPTYSNGNNAVIYQNDSPSSVAYQPLSDISAEDVYSRPSRNKERVSENESCCGSEYYASCLNTSLDETKYLSTKDVGGFLTEQEKNSLLIYSSDCERQYNTGRKSRSRIRTNPWLPSPSSTPYNASRAFPRVQSLASPLPTCDDSETEHFHGDKDVFMETDVSPTTPGSTDSGFKSLIASDINIKNSSCTEIVPETQVSYQKSKSALQRFREENINTVLKASESFDTYANSGVYQEKYCVRSQTTLDIDNITCDAGTLDKLKWRNHEDLTSPTICNISCFEWEPENSCFFSPSTELSPSMFPIVEHNISFEYEENLEVQLENPQKHRDPSSTSIADLLHDDITKEVAVQTDFEDAEDSDWMTASSFDDTIELNQSSRKLSLISDCMQESTDTGYSSLTRDGLLDFEEDQFASNKENITRNNLNIWLDNKDQTGASCSMGHSWTEKTVERIATDPKNFSFDYMCQSWYEGASRDIHSDIPFDMTTSMYIPATEVLLRQDLFKERHQTPMLQHVNSDQSHTDQRKSQRENYTPILEYGPIIKRPIPQSPVAPSAPSKYNDHKANERQTELVSRHTRPNILDYKEMKVDAVSSPDLENIAPQAASTPTERTPRYRSKAHILENVKSQLSSMNNRSNGRTKSKKTESRKARDNLDVIRDYMGYASFEDFYFAKQCPPLSTGRTLNQIKTSLEEKVDRLRQEKLLVEMKINEAQEEERAKNHEKMKYQKQLNSQRKQLLLQTLNDLKDKLENQSDRLQKSYSTILTLQHRFTRRNSNLSLLKTGPM